jgi:hypothetical protein
MSVRLSRLVGLLALCLPLAACATAATAGGEELSPPSAIYEGAIAQNVTYADSGLTLRVPPPSASARAPLAQAYVANCESGDAICVVGERPTIFLAVATLTTAGEEQKDGTIRPVMEDTLVYVIQYTKVPCVGSGPPRRTKSAPSPTTSVCTILNFVDAASGAVLHSIQGPGLEPVT